MVVNITEASDRVEGDHGFYIELASDFLGEFPQTLGKLRAALSEGDAQQVERTAHTMKGALLNLAASEASLVAQKIEERGRSKNLTDVDSMVRSLEADVARFKAAIEELRVKGSW